MTTESAVEKDMQLDILDSGIACLTINIRGSKVNTLGKQSMTELAELVEKIVADKKVRGLVISSGKHESFIAGADVKEIQEIQSRFLEEAYQASKLGKEIFQKIADLPYNTVAAINGDCLGGGTELTLACKYRLASPNAKIGLPETQLGFIPGWGGCVRLPKLVGVETALNLIMSGKILSAKEAYKSGLINEIVEAKELLPRAMQVARDGGPKPLAPDLKESLKRLVLEKNQFGLNNMLNTAYKGMMAKTKGKYPAVKEALDVIIRSATLPEKDAFELESAVFAKLAMTEVSRNLVGIFFAQQESKKLPVKLSEEKKVSTVGILGAGVMGAGIAQAAAKAGYKVIVKDVKPEFIEKGKATVSGLFADLVKKHRMSQSEMDKVMGQMVFTTDYAPMAECDLVVEAVIEDLQAKKNVLAELENVITNDFVFGSNTSSLSIRNIAEAARHPASVVGIHFFNPVHKMPLVEVVKGRQTDDETASRAMSFAMKLGKTTVLTGDAAGFVVNRILAPYMREAAVLAEQGVPVEEIDKAMKAFGMPMGPMALLDEVGLDIAGKVIHVMHEALGERLAEPPIMKAIQGLKLLGKKGGKGIYLYDEKGKAAGVNPDFQACIKAAPLKLQKSQIQDRLVLLMLNEAVRILEEEIVTDPSQLDLAIIFGTGFAPFEGGILRYADSHGVRLLCDKLELLAQAEDSRYKPCELLRQKARNREKFYCVKAVSQAAEILTAG